MTSYRGMTSYSAMSSYQILPQVLQDLIGEFNVEHRPKMKMVFNELLEKHKNTEIINARCSNCCNESDPIYTKNILFHKYTFCSEWCEYDLELSIRKSWRKRHMN